MRDSGGQRARVRTNGIGMDVLLVYVSLYVVGWLGFCKGCLAIHLSF